MIRGREPNLKGMAEIINCTLFFASLVCQLFNYTRDKNKNKKSTEENASSFFISQLKIRLHTEYEESSL
jgi:hypothetical protein